MASGSCLRRTLASAAWILGGLLASCTCGAPALDGIYGELQVSAQLPEYGREALVSLPDVLEGDLSKRSIWVRNSGLASITLTGIATRSGERVALDAPPDEEHPFAAWLPREKTLPPGSVAEVRMEFRARPGAEDPEHVASFMLQAGGTRPGEGEAAVRLSAVAWPSPCAMPEEIDFGPVLVGQVESRAFALRNPLSRESVAELGAPVSGVAGEAARFFYANGGPGSVSVAARASREVLVSFQPREARRLGASIEVAAAPSCAPAKIQLVGEGRTRFLDWEPARVDCGWVLPGERATRSLRLINRGPGSIALSGVRIETGEGVAEEEFSLVAARATSLEPGGVEELSVECGPRSLGRKVATLVVETDVRGQARVSIALEARGGGPRIGLSPGFLDLGKVIAYELGSPVVESGTVTVANLGQALAQDAAGAALRLGTLQADGGYGPPYYRVEPMTPETGAQEFYLDLSFSPAIQAANQVPIPVRLAPASIGSKRARVVVYSNDPTRPEASFEVAAEVRHTGTCRFSLSPNPLDFGVVHSTAPKTLGLTFENTAPAGGEACLVSVAGLQQEGAEYSIEGEPGEEVQVPPGGILTIPVTFTPGSVGGDDYRESAGKLLLKVSNPVTPELEVPLKGGSGPACLTLLPTEMDFGAVKPAERSEERVVQILHLCSGPIRLIRASLVGAASDFELRTLSPIPEGGLKVRTDSPSWLLDGQHDPPPEAPNTFPVAVRYAPRTAVAHRAAVVFELERKGEPLRYVLPVKGRADQARIASVSYVQGGGDPVDVLIYFNSYEPLAWSREGVAQQAPAFIQHLDTSGNNYQIALQWKWPNLAGWDRYGELIVGDGHPDRILRPGTPDLVAQFQRKLRRQIDLNETGEGSRDVYHAWRTVIPPASTGTNAGFVRPGARLALIRLDHAYEGRYSYPPVEMDTEGFPPFPSDVGMFIKAMAGLKDAGAKGFSFSSLSFVRYPNHDTRCMGGDDFPGLPWFAVADQIMAAATGGRVGEWCPAEESEWPGLVEMLAESASGLRTHFRLPSRPDLGAGPIEVMVDGVAAASTDATGAVLWEYQPAENAVHFPVDRTPRPGQKVTVRYRSVAPSP